MRASICGGILSLALFIGLATHVSADPIHRAAEDGDWPALQEELNRGVDVNTPDYDGCTALMWAAENGHEEVVRNLLQVPRINANAICEHERLTALMYAAENGHENIVVQLSKVPGIDVNVQDYYGCTALMSAAKGGYKKALLQLLQNPGINLNLKDNDGKTVFDLAGTEEIKELLNRMKNHFVNTTKPYKAISKKSVVTKKRQFTGEEPAAKKQKAS